MGLDGSRLGFRRRRRRRRRGHGSVPQSVPPCPAPLPYPVHSYPAFASVCLQLALQLQQMIPGFVVPVVGERREALDAHSPFHLPGSVHQKSHLLSLITIDDGWLCATSTSPACQSSPQHRLCTKQSRHTRASERERGR